MTAVSTPAILSQMSALSDPVRARLLRLLDRHELTVAELCGVLQLPQSTTSRHLRALADQGWIVSRRDGTRTMYRMMLDDLSPAARELWLLVREQVGSTHAAAGDDQRVERVLRERQSRSQAFFSTAAGQWDHMRAELFGSRFDIAALAGLLDSTWSVGDLGCGTGQTSEALAPFVAEVMAVDESSAMLDAARQRLQRFDNVQVKQGALDTLPIADQALDAAVMTLVLHHLPKPAEVLREAARTVKPAGKLLIVDMLPHDRREYQQSMGHVWLGFEEAEMTGWLTDAGFERTRIVPLPADPEAKGPTLFAASAIRAAE